MSMRSYEQEKPPPGNGYNQLSETSGSIGVSQTNTGTEKIRDIGRQVHVDTFKKN